MIRFKTGHILNDMSLTSQFRKARCYIFARLQFCDQILDWYEDFLSMFSSEYTFFAQTKLYEINRNEIFYCNKTFTKPENDPHTKNNTSCASVVHTPLITYELRFSNLGNRWLVHLVVGNKDSAGTALVVIQSPCCCLLCTFDVQRFAKTIQP